MYLTIIKGIHTIYVLNYLKKDRARMSEPKKRARNKIKKLDLR